MKGNGTPRRSTDQRGTTGTAAGDTCGRKTAGNDMLRRLGIRAKVMAVLAVPILVIFGAGAYISYGALQDLRYAKAAEGVISTLEAYGPLASAVQTERLLSLNGGTPEQMVAARAETDTALASVRPSTANLDLSQFPQP